MLNVVRYLNGSYLRQYTPPTCTLEISAKQSPLSQWTNRPVLKDLRFRLRFDDPRVPEERHATIEGDRDSLDSLYTAVATYVGQLLQTTPARFNAMLVGTHTGRDRASSPNLRPMGLKTEPNAAGIFLEAVGLVSHHLHLGAIATSASGSIVRLSVLQLFDLAAALDEWAAETLALPSLEAPSKSKILPIGASAAAALVAAGLTAVWLRQQQVQTEMATEEAREQQISASDRPTPLAAPPAPETDTDSELPGKLLPSPSTKGNTDVPPPPPPLPVPDRVQVPATPPAPGTIAPPETSPTAPAPGGSTFVIPESAPEPAPFGQAPPDLNFVPFSPGEAPPPGTQRQLPAQPPAIPDIALNDIEAEEALPPSQARGMRPQRAPAAEAEPFELSGEPRQPTLFDEHAPQVAQVRSYFDRNWSPLEGVTRSLEYTIVVQSDGTVGEVIPMGSAARNFRDRVVLPAPGDAIATPGATPVRVRVVLDANGEVQTFLQSREGN